jgi:hypothetical protein
VPIDILDMVRPREGSTTSRVVAARPAGPEAAAGGTQLPSM